MWTYQQSTGELSQDGELKEVGYAGMNEGKNNPDMQDVPNVGPLPVGVYTIGSPHDTTTHGPYVLRLTPSPTNDMLGRAGFLMHSDSIHHPGFASEGCIILTIPMRRTVWESDDHTLEVIA